MNLYAQIIDNKVVAVIPSNCGAPDIAGDIIDITELQDKPSVGWMYYDEFVAPANSMWYDDISVADMKEHRINILKDNCNQSIYKVYPVWKQINYMNHAKYDDITEDDYNDMVEFIANKRSICNLIETQINAFETKEEINNILVDI